jgi:LmbE family N-acetylglucosaminyl deacetylase
MSILEPLQAITQASSFTPVAAASLTLYGYYRKRLDVFPQSAIHEFPQLPTPSTDDRVLFLSPHQDDETLSSSGYLQAAVTAGAKLKVALITDGNKHGLKKTRMKEWRSALRQSGIGPKDTIKLHFADGATSHHRISLRRRLAEIITEFQPTVIIAPHPADIHQDHRAVARTILSLWEPRQTALYLYLIHYPPFFPWPRKEALRKYLLPPARRVLDFGEPWAVFPLTQKQQENKKKALLEYESQLHTPFLRGLMFALVRQNEVFMVAEARHKESLLKSKLHSKPPVKPK